MNPYQVSQPVTDPEEFFGRKTEMEEELTQFFTKNTRALVSITKYCLDKAVELKK